MPISEKRDTKYLSCFNRAAKIEETVRLQDGVSTTSISIILDFHGSIISQ